MAYVTIPLRSDNFISSIKLLRWLIYNSNCSYQNQPHPLYGLKSAKDFIESKRNEAKANSQTTFSFKVDDVLRTQEEADNYGSFDMAYSSVVPSFLHEPIMEMSIEILPDIISIEEFENELI